MQKPSLARMVLVLVDPIGNNGSDVCPAVITRVWGAAMEALSRPQGDDLDFHVWMVNLKTIKDGNVDEWLTSRTLYPTEEEARQSGKPGACFWPPRV